MPTNPLSYKLPSSVGGGDITCLSNSTSYHLVIVIFDTNNAIAFTGSGVGKALTIHSGATHAPVAPSAVPTPVTIMFFSLPALHRGAMTLTTIKDPVVTPRPWGQVINIKSQEKAAHDYDCIMTINLNG